ncbi:MAG: hypothetical protein WA517_18190 [Candidatus Acidiferrum sp.]
MTSMNSGTGVATRCQYPFSDGRFCRTLRSPDHSSFCAFHARQELQLLASQRLGTEISETLNGDFLTATDINHVLGKLFIAVPQDRIPTREAAVFTYLGQVMLSSLAHVKEEFPFSYKFDHWTKKLDQADPLSDPPSLTDPSSSSEPVPEPPEPGEPSSPKNSNHSLLSHRPRRAL